MIAHSGLLARVRPLLCRVVWLAGVGSMLPALVSAPSHGAEVGAITPETLAVVKRATVYVRVRNAEGTVGSGSGFVISTSNRRALIATNHHVLGPRPDSGPVVSPPAVPRPQPRYSATPSYLPYPYRGYVPGRSYQPGSRYVPGGNSPFASSTTPPLTLYKMAADIDDSTITVVFNSGTPQEHAVRGTAIASDPDLDLAIIEVADVGDLPSPLESINAKQLYETLSVYSLGFPFGADLSTSNGANPAITVGKASISSLRRDGDGKLRSIQIDGTVNRGNSGSPLVDTDGKLVGMIGCKITNADGVGFATPIEVLDEALLGRFGPCRAAHVPSSTGILGIQLGSQTCVEASLFDPHRRLQELTLIFAPVGDLTSEPEKIVDLTQAANHWRIKLDRDPLYVSTPFPPKGETATKFAVQIVAERSGKPIRSKVSVLTFPAARTSPKNLAEAPKKSPTPKPADTPKSEAALPPSAALKPKALTKEQPVLEETPVLGGTSRDGLFREAAPAGGHLIGFEVRTGEFTVHPYPRQITPIFHVDGKETNGTAHGSSQSEAKRVVAKRGYAVGAITVRPSLMIVGFSCTFMKVKGDRLDPTDNYESEWLGSRTIGRGEEKLGGDGRMVIGLVGKEGRLGCTGLGLLLSPIDDSATASHDDSKPESKSKPKAKVKAAPKSK